MRKFNNGDFVIFTIGPEGGFRDTTPGKPYKIENDMYRDDTGILLWVDGWDHGEFNIDRIITAEQYEEEFVK